MATTEELERGFGQAIRQHHGQDKKAGPRLVFDGGTQTIFVADMCGDGFTDLVRIGNGQVYGSPRTGPSRCPPWPTWAMAGRGAGGTMAPFATARWNDMPSTRFIRPAAQSILALCLLVAGAGTANADSARRLKIDLELRRDGSMHSGADQGRGRLEQKLTLTAVLHTDGSPMPSNPLDPEDGKRQLERAQRSQQRVQSAQGRHGSAPAAAPDLAAMQAQAQQLMARCGQDRECLMREASAISAAQVAGGDRATQARLQAYGQAAAACERQPAKAREACQGDARRRAGGGEDEADEVVETPYLMFFGRPGCRLETTVKIDGRVEGSFQDVQGTVPFTETAQAQQTRRDDTLCPLLQVVLDQRSGRLWTHVMAVDAAPGVHMRSEKGRSPQRSEGPVPLRWMEAGPWIQQRLSRLSDGGEDRTQLPATGGGRTEVVLRWRFEPV